MNGPSWTSIFEVVHLTQVKIGRPKDMKVDDRPVGSSTLIRKFLFGSIGPSSFLVHDRRHLNCPVNNQWTVYFYLDRFVKPW